MGNSGNSVSQLQTEISIDKLTICDWDIPTAQTLKAIDALGDLSKVIPGLQLDQDKFYAARAVIPLPAAAGVKKQNVFVQVGPKISTFPCFRIEFNPSKTSLEALIELRAIIKTLTGCPSIKFLQFGKVTRCDVAIDIFGICVEETLIWYKGKRKHSVTSLQAPQTVTIGTRKSGLLRFYDKKLPDGSALRIEFQLKPNIPGALVSSLANPLSKVEIYPSAILENLLKGVPGRTIGDSTLVRGRAKALALFPAKDRKKIATALSNSGSPIPNADALWSKWPQALNDVGLGEDLGAWS